MNTFRQWYTARGGRWYCSIDDRYFCQSSILDERKVRKACSSQPTSKSEIYAYKSIAGTLLNFCQTVLSREYYTASWMQQELDKQYVSDVLEGPLIICELKKMKSVITFCKPSPPAQPRICSLSDVSGSSSCKAYGHLCLYVEFESRFSHEVSSLHLCDLPKGRKIILTYLSGQNESLLQTLTIDSFT